MAGWTTAKPIWAIAGVILVLLLLAGGRYPGTVQNWMYVAFRESARIALHWQTRGYLESEGEHFKVKYLPSDAGIADIVLEAAERIYQPVNQTLGFTPREKIPIIIYPSEKDLAHSFGWPADEGALGAYWMGSIRVLSPKAWIENEDLIRERFWEAGPMAHEYTHYVIDHLTRGNHPRWFTEGMAQWKDYQLTGFMFSFGDDALTQTKPYSLKQLDREFDDQPNQLMAYWQALAAVEFLDQQYSIDKIKELINRLGEGYNLEVAFRTTFGISFAEFETEYQVWLQEKLPCDSLAPAAAPGGLN